MKAALFGIAVGSLLGMADSEPGRRAIHVFRGRPIAYRVRIIDGGIMATKQPTRIEECFISGTRVAITLGTEA